MNNYDGKADSKTICKGGRIARRRVMVGGLSALAMGWMVADRGVAGDASAARAQNSKPARTKGDRMKHVLVFDVIETLLDLRALDPHFKRVFHDQTARHEWFAQMLQSALVSTVTNTYSDFSAIGRAALEMTAARRGVALGENEFKLILGAVRTLPPHSEVSESLARLKQAGFRLATLTNSTAAVAAAQMKHTGLDKYFEQVLSADTARRLKPAAEAYRMAAQKLRIEPKEIRLVAAHAWDVAGAMRAGCAAAFVARPGMVLDPLAERPDIIGPDLSAVAGKILEVEK